MIEGISIKSTNRGFRSPITEIIPISIITAPITNIEASTLVITIVRAAFISVPLATMDVPTLV